MLSKLFVAISSGLSYSDLFTDMVSKAYVATIKFLLYTDTLQIMGYFEFALMCSHSHM